MIMWQKTREQPIVTKISKQWTPNNSMRFGTILLLGFVGVIGHTSAAGVPEIKSSSTQPVSPANLISLKQKLELFHVKYSATLMNSTFLPFLKDCSDNFDKNADKMSYTDRLCISYYDMINSIYHLNEFENSDSVTRILEKYNGKKMTDRFCTFFPDEMLTRLEKQPFADATNITNWLKINDCVTSCMHRDDKAISEWCILDICKLIAGGLSEAVNKSKIETEMTPAKETSAPINNSNNTINEKKDKAVTIEPTNSNATKIENKTVETTQEKHKVAEPVQSIEEGKQPNDQIAADPEDSEQTNDTKIDDSRNYDMPDNDDAADEAENHSEDGQHETPLETNSNNLQSRLSANINEFREDNESSFFSYFMFLMFAIITFYVAYHNKSKILALLIEGRRGRTYSARGGTRRKSHSAEYRKLDCNLEEAIQSGGSQTLSSQIIY